MYKILIALVLSFVLTAPAFAGDKLLAKQLQAISVTIKAKTHYGEDQGSGVIVTRIIDGKKINFVWTAAHVVDSLRTTRSVVDPRTGTKRILVEFKRAHIVQELLEGGQRVGEIKMDAEVVRYSNAKNGEDLALLRVLKKDFISGGATFYLEKEIPLPGTGLYHCGSLLGQFGANSVTKGMVNQIGRVLPSVANKVFDQTSVKAFPGSSGGGVFLAEGKHKGKYSGMLVRGAGETFNFIVPIRRMITWASRTGVLFALDPSIKPPTEKELRNMPVEDSGVPWRTSVSKKRTRSSNPYGSKHLEFLIKRVKLPVKRIKQSKTY